MRALRQIVGAVLLASVMAQSFVNSADFRGRALEEKVVYHNDGTESTTVFPKYTKRFANTPDTWASDSRDAEWKAEPITWIGLGVGGGVTFIFFIFAVINIVYDEGNRHAELKGKVERVQEQLMEDYGVTQEEINDFINEFEDKEMKGDAVDEEAERKALAEIN